MFETSCCRLCINICNGHKSLFDADDQRSEIYELAAKYFTTELLEMEWLRHLKNICLECWRHLVDFQSFQQSVILAQKLALCNIPSENRKNKPKLLAITITNDTAVLSTPPDPSLSNVAQNELSHLSSSQFTGNFGMDNDFQTRIVVPSASAITNSVHDSDILVEENLTENSRKSSSQTIGNVKALEEDYNDARDSAIASFLQASDMLHKENALLNTVQNSIISSESVRNTESTIDDLNNDRHHLVKEVTPAAAISSSVQNTLVTMLVKENSALEEQLRSSSSQLIRNTNSNEETSNDIVILNANDIQPNRNTIYLVSNADCNSPVQGIMLGSESQHKQTRNSCVGMKSASALDSSQAADSNRLRTEELTDSSQPQVEMNESVLLTLSSTVFSIDDSSSSQDYDIFEEVTSHREKEANPTSSIIETPEEKPTGPTETHAFLNDSFSTISSSIFSMEDNSLSEEDIVEITNLPHLVPDIVCKAEKLVMPNSSIVLSDAISESSEEDGEVLSETDDEVVGIFSCLDNSWKRGHSYTSSCLNLERNWKTLQNIEKEWQQLDDPFGSLFQKNVSQDAKYSEEYSKAKGLEVVNLSKAKKIDVRKKSPETPIVDVESQFQPSRYNKTYYRRSVKAKISSSYRDLNDKSSSNVCPESSIALAFEHFLTIPDFLQQQAESDNSVIPKASLPILATSVATTAKENKKVKKYLATQVQAKKPQILAINRNRYQKTYSARSLNTKSSLKDSSDKTSSNVCFNKIKE